MKVTRMPFKRLLTSAAIVFLGCSDAATDGVDVPPYAGNWTPPNTSGAQPVNESPDPGGVQPSDGTNGGVTPVDTTPPVNDQPSNEGQNAGDVPLQGGNTDNGAGNGSGAGTGAGDGANSGGQQPTDGTGNGDGNGDPNGPGAGNGDTPTETPAEPEPEPVVFPPLDCAAPRPQLSGGTQACQVNASGNVDGQSWFMWYSGQNGCMTPVAGLGGAFRATWNNSGDFLARMGQFFGETQTHDQIGNIGADLQFAKSGSGGNYSFIGIYGWSNNPLVEYYIVEDSFGNGAATPFGTQQRGQFNVDGATYRIYTGTKTNQPSIHGTATFTQVFSVRQSPRQCGHVSISDHFRQWESMGIGLGLMYEARVLVEAGGGTGSIDFTRASVTVE
jgi:hypothetical protein